ncbi:hypothetical protein QUB63_22930 [Microcoleus sp. ARI1-B5]|uniref:hypothetical protein n=1 Tax=unclassified Microcoleus TaxID=2642155 RepID=UPI002FD49A3C
MSGSPAIALADITYAFRMRANTSKQPCRRSANRRWQALNALYLQACDGFRQMAGSGSGAVICGGCRGILLPGAIVLGTGDR